MALPQTAVLQLPSRSAGLQSGVFFARVISYLFHPLLLPTLGLFLVFNLQAEGIWLWLPSPEWKWFIYSLTALSTFLMPALVALALYKMKFISSLEMQTKEERRIPYITSAIFYFAASWLLMRWEVVPALIKAMMLGYTLLVVCTLAINVFWKISAHMVGIGGICGMMIAASFRLQADIHYVLIALFLVAGLVAFSRLRLNAHDPAQVYAGFLLGIFVQLFLYL